jgi:glutathione synthase/RimK-type ligase-like ATP-grasp enzyme
MDPIERIKIAGDSTFALLLEAQSRGHALAYYTPDKLALSEGKSSPAFNRSACATRPAIISRSARRNALIFRPST